MSREDFIIDAGQVCRPICLCRWDPHGSRESTRVLLEENGHRCLADAFEEARVFAIDLVGGVAKFALAGGIAFRRDHDDLFARRNIDSGTPRLSRSHVAAFFIAARIVATTIRIWSYEIVSPTISRM